MIPLLYIKLGVVALLLAAFLGLGWTANHYHNAYLEADSRVTAKQVELNSALTSLKDCSAMTDELKKAADDKQGVVQKAQEQASILAKNNQKLSDKILSAKPSSPDSCVAAGALFKQYKKEALGK